ncbi:MAG: hypothetical protein KKB37_11300 [Alphaproteobacteria bacterium]|nr:hypothetical protein [Alphaproteobacteria bacterium]
MSNPVTIDGAEVDLEAPCDVVKALKRVEMKIAIGGAVGRTNVQGEEVEFTEANLPRLQSLLAKYQADCDRNNGVRPRFAKTVSWV